MNLLLDTHTLLWALGSPGKLSAAAREALEDPAHDIFVSAVSFFEISTKLRSGKLAVPLDLLTSWEWTMARLGARLLPLSIPAAICAGQLDWGHPDPFDRLLAAQALVDQLKLVSIDSQLHDCPNLEVFW